MALPFILWGAAAALAATGVVKGVEAKGNFSEAKEIGENARKRYEKSENKTLALKNKTNERFTELGRLKLETFKNQIQHLVDAINRSKNASSKLSGFDEAISIEELEEMKMLVLQSLEIEKGLGLGAATGALAAWGAYGSVGVLASASTGTAIASLSGAAATNATLAWLGGGALSAGGYGIAGGTIALGGIVLGPALAVGGFMLASKAEKALTQAHEYEKEVAIAVAEMEKIEVVLSALETNAIELIHAIQQMARRFDTIKVIDDSNPEAFKQMAVIGKGIKNLLDIAIMDSSGAANKHLKSQISGLLEI